MTEKSKKKCLKKGWKTRKNKIENERREKPVWLTKKMSEKISERRKEGLEWNLK